MLAASQARTEPSRAEQHEGLERAYRVIKEFEPTAAREFIRITGIALQYPSGVARSDGLLNRTGAPVEFAFNTLTDELRYTLEVGTAGIPPENRFALLPALLEKLGAESRWDGVLRRFSDLQRTGPLQWGAWLGVRHPAQSGKGEVLRSPQYKIYAEVAVNELSPCSDLLKRYLGPGSILPSESSQLVLVGANPQSERCEFYFALHKRRLTLACLNRLLSRISLQSRQQELVDLIRSFEFRQGHAPDTLPPGQYGFSYSVLPGGVTPFFSLFVVAADLAGGDAALRWQILRSARAFGSSLGCYAALTEPLSKKYGNPLFHNMISFTVGLGSAPGFQVSLSPPPDIVEEQ